VGKWINGVWGYWKYSEDGTHFRIPPIFHRSITPVLHRSYKRNSDKKIENFDPVNLAGLPVVSSHAKLVPARHFFYVKFHSAVHSSSSSI
jgi:hypothetical protein